MKVVVNVEMSWYVYVDLSSVFPEVVSRCWMIDHQVVSSVLVVVVHVAKVQKTFLLVLVISSSKVKG